MCIGSYADISIYVPTRGAIYIYAHHLNSTLISIHAPTRGATTTNAKRETENAFQSTLPREERRAPAPAINKPAPNFNPRSHERSDRVAVSTIRKFCDFNPRSHERSDSACNVAILSLVRFQSTLPREERQQYCTKNLFIFIQYR